MALGDHIRVSRGWYYHHGIDAGDGTVIHLRGEPLRARNACVERCEIATFLRGGHLETVGAPAGDEGPRVLARALSRLDEAGYDLLFANCEHFAAWARDGKSRSEQVERWSRAGMVAGAVTVAAGQWALRRGASRVLPRVFGPAGAALTVVGGAVTLGNWWRRR